METAGAQAADLIARLYDDPEECARLAALRYVSPEDPGLTRVRCGRGFTYRDAHGTTVADVRVRERIARLAIPPAWRNVWICASEDGHLLAVGEDEKGRRQYLYHERWRSIRDQLNFYRLIGFGAALPAVRADVAGQLRRRTLDTDRVIAAMLRIIDRVGLRVGNEVYAEENDSYGLTTLLKRHVQVEGTTVRFAFPAKSGKRADVALRDPGVARVVGQLLDGRGRRLFTVAGAPVSSDAVNARLAELAGARVTAKDFRTWHGTITVFRHLRDRLPAGEDAETHILAAVDAAALALNNTRTVARAHYVHPQVLDGYTSGQLAEFLRRQRPGRDRWLDADEQLLLAYLTSELDAQAADLFPAA